MFFYFFPTIPKFRNGNISIDVQQLHDFCELEGETTCFPGIHFLYSLPDNQCRSSNCDTTWQSIMWCWNASVCILGDWRKLLQLHNAELRRLITINDIIKWAKVQNYFVLLMIFLFFLFHVDIIVTEKTPWPNNLSISFVSWSLSNRAINDITQLP